AAGDILGEVETDKATMEMESFDDGVVHKFLVAAGEKVPCGTPIALLLGKNEQPPADGALPKIAEPKPAAAAGSAAPPGAAAAVAHATGSRAATSTSGSRAKASPLAKKIAASK